MLTLGVRWQVLQVQEPKGSESRPNKWSLINRCTGTSFDGAPCRYVLHLSFWTCADNVWPLTTCGYGTPEMWWVQAEMCRSIKSILDFKDLVGKKGSRLFLWITCKNLLYVKMIIFYICWVNKLCYQNYPNHFIFSNVATRHFKLICGSHYISLDSTVLFCVHISILREVIWQNTH